MFYIVTEDSASGLQFWEMISDKFGLDCVVVTTSGSGKFRNIVHQGYREVAAFLKYELTDSDSVLLCYDSLNTSRLNTTILKKGFSECPARLYLSQFRCIESIILSFIYLESWLGLGFAQSGETSGDNSLYLDVYNEVFSYLRFRKAEQAEIALGYCMDLDTPDKLPAGVAAYLKTRKSKNVNLANAEQLFADLLLQISIRSRFRIDKSRIYECWYKDCCWDVLDCSGLEIKRRFAKICDQLNSWDELRCKMQLNTNGVSARYKLSMLVAYSELQYGFIELRTGHIVSLFDIIGYPLEYFEFRDILDSDRIVEERLKGAALAGFIFWVAGHRWMSSSGLSRLRIIFCL